MQGLLITARKSSVQDAFGELRIRDKEGRLDADEHHKSKEPCGKQCGQTTSNKPLHYLEVEDFAKSETDVASTEIHHGRHEVHGATFLSTETGAVQLPVPAADAEGGLEGFVPEPEPTRHRKRLTKAAKNEALKSPKSPKAAPFLHFEEFFGLKQHCNLCAEAPSGAKSFRACGFGPSILERRVASTYSAAHMQDTLEILKRPVSSACVSCSASRPESPA